MKTGMKSEDNLLISSLESALRTYIEPASEYNAPFAELHMLRSYLITTHRSWQRIGRNPSGPCDFTARPSIALSGQPCISYFPLLAYFIWLLFRM